MNADPEREKRLFVEALQFGSPAEVESFLQNACGADLELRLRIEMLLTAHRQAGDFLQNPTASVSPNTLLSASGAAFISEKPGDTIGRYKLREQIGEGGCGVVYVAEQEHPLRRRVALKILKLGMDTKQVVARFEAERQALALMDHPNIAKVLDAGATDTGRPFFVMELVRGIKITDYCDRNHLSAPERLALFIQVCAAIEHAHQKGIIHRDIKPSNILVTLHDGVPVPKVIDFGIAKATTDQRLTDKTIYTAFEQFLGTPAYMSPEQAEMSGLELDTRSDIYSLGVLLYELLTGKTPFDATALLKAGLNEMRRIICEQEPARPSTRLSTLDHAALTSVATFRHTDPPKLVSLIRGDLDWVVMKSLEKDRTRRYASAKEMAMDLQRHLRNEPVVARPPSQLYRLRKLLVRRRTAFATGALACLTAMAALIIGMRISRNPVSEAGRPLRSNDQQPLPVDATPSALRSTAVSRIVSGVVLAEDTGKPLVNALVLVSAPSVDMRFARSEESRFSNGHTDAKGRFQISVPLAQTLSLDAFFPGYQSAAGSIMGGPGSGVWLEALPFTNSAPEFTIKLIRALYVAGMVVDEKGQAFPQAEVEATIQMTDGMAYVAQTRTDTNGQFEVFDFPLQSNENVRGQITFESPFMLRSSVQDVYRLSESERRSLKVVLHRGHDIRGVVISAGGRPAANTLVEAIPADENASYKQQTTDGEGHYLMQGLPDGEVTVRVHSFKLEQKAQTTSVVASKDLELDLKLEPVVLKNPPQLQSLFGMKLADINPELQAAYDLGETTGVLIVDPGEIYGRLQIGTLEEGEYFLMVGNERIHNLEEMVDELLRINDIDPHAKGESATEGHRGEIRIVYSGRHWSNTTYIKLTEDDAAELKRLATKLREKNSK